MLKHGVELDGESIHLFVGQRQARQARHVLDICSRQHGGRVYGRCWSVLAAPVTIPARYHPPVAKHQFLSDDWFAIVDTLVQDLGAEAPENAELVMNLVVTDTPFGAERLLHVGARHGRGHWGIGHAADADLTVTTDYETAREILLSGDPQAGLNAFLTGKVKIQGDFAKLMATQAAAPAGASGLAEAIQGITA